MACDGDPLPTFNSCDASLVDCAVTLAASIDVPCGADSYTLHVYKKKDEAPTGLPEEEIDSETIDAGPTTHVYSGSDDISGEGCGDWYYLFRIECTGVGTYGTCSDTVSKSTTATIDSFDANLDSENCEVDLSVQVDVPCNCAEGTAKVYKRLGSAPSATAEYLHDTQVLPAGVQSNLVINFASHDVTGAPGTWHYLVELTPGLGCSPASATDTAVVSDSSPTLVDCDASELSCTITLDANVNIPCPATGYVLRVYVKKDDTPTGLAEELHEEVNLPDGEDTYNYDGTYSILGAGCGTWNFLFRVEKAGTPYSTCTDNVSKSNGYTIDFFSASYSEETCAVNFFAQVDIPCNIGESQAKLYKKLGSAPSSSPEYLHQTVDLPAGPQNDYTINFDAHTLACGADDPGTWHYKLELIPGGGCSSQNADANVTVAEEVPILSNVGVNVNKDCEWTLSAKVAYGCMHDVPRYQVRAYYRYGAAVPAVPPAQSQTGAAFDVPCGPGSNNLSWNGSTKSEGMHYWKVILFDNGAPIQQVQVQARITGCNELTLVPSGSGQSVPHEGIDELIYLVEVERTGQESYTYTDRRILINYQLITWNYHRKGGCGSFRLLLRENFPEAGRALENGWEVHVRIRLPDEDAPTTWYRGVIRTVKRQYEGNELLTEVAGQGYLEQLANVQVQRRYPKGVTVGSIVQDILTNSVLPHTRITQEATPTDGIDSSDYLTTGPLHFECSALKAIKFLAELQGDREFGVASDRNFYFRSKKTEIEDALFSENDVINVIDGGKGVQKVNRIDLGGKLWGHEQTDITYGDITDISNFGLFQKPVMVPHVEHRLDGMRWSENIVNLKKGTTLWKTLSWTVLDKRLERNHPTEGLGQLRIYGADVSSEITDLDIQKIVYTKGGYINKGEIREIHDPKTQQHLDQPVLRAVVYAGFQHHDLVEELEERNYDPIAMIRASLRQYANPRVDVTNPNRQDENTTPGQLWAQPIPGSTDVTAGRFRLRMRDDLTNWPDIIKMRAGDVTTPASGDYPGEEFFVYSDAARTQGTKYYWDGTSWRSMNGGGGGGGGGGGASLSSSTPTTITPDAPGTAGVSSEAARGDHEHPIAADPAVDITNANAEGASSAFSRADHKHRGIRSVHVKGQAEIDGHVDITTQGSVSASQNGNTITIKGEASGAEVEAGTPVDITQANFEGTEETFARSDHEHRGIRSVHIKGQPENAGHIDITTVEGLTVSQQGNTLTFRLTTSPGALALGDFLLHAD